MAKSLFDIQEAGTAEVTHVGEETIVTLPLWWQNLAEAALVESADPDEYWETLIDTDKRAILQASAAKTLIELRAAARPADFPASAGGGSRRLMEPDANGRQPQDRVDAYELTPLKRPGSSGRKTAKQAADQARIDTWNATAQALHAAGQPTEMIRTVLEAADCPSDVAERLAAKS